MNMSSRYTWMNWLMQSQKIVVISHWNVEGALQSPICITWLLNVPSTVANTILWTCSGMMRICSYALDISSFERYATLAISLQMISWSGNGVTSLTMLSFCSHKSKTVRSLPFSLVCRALAPLDVPLWVSTTVQWCISQFSERALRGNALGISAASSGYIFQDQLDWSHGSPPG